MPGGSFYNYLFNQFIWLIYTKLKKVFMFFYLYDRSYFFSLFLSLTYLFFFHFRFNIKKRRWIWNIHCSSYVIFFNQKKKKMKINEPQKKRVWYNERYCVFIAFILCKEEKNKPTLISISLKTKQKHEESIKLFC